MNDKLMIRTGALKLIIGVLFLLFIPAGLLFDCGERRLKSVQGRRSRTVLVWRLLTDAAIFMIGICVPSPAWEKTNYAVVFSDGNRTVDFDVCKDLAKYSDESEYDIYGRLYRYGKTTVKRK